jgi:hypothetical protein
MYAFWNSFEHFSIDGSIQGEINVVPQNKCYELGYVNCINVLLTGVFLGGNGPQHCVVVMYSVTRKIDQVCVCVCVYVDVCKGDRCSCAYIIKYHTVKTCGALKGLTPRAISEVTTLR